MAIERTPRAGRASVAIGPPARPPLGDLPLVVLLDDHGGEEPVDGGIVGEDADDVRAALHLAMHTSGLVDQIGRQCTLGKAAKANRSW